MNLCYIFLNVSFFHPVQRMEVEAVVHTFSMHNKKITMKAVKPEIKTKKSGLDNMSVFEKCEYDKVNNRHHPTNASLLYFFVLQFNITIVIC